MSRRVFSADEDAALAALIALNKSTAAIAIALGRSESSISSRAKTLAEKAGRPLPKAAQAPAMARPKKTLRPCMCCRTEFASDGPHNRLCAACRRIETTPFDRL